MDKAMKILTVDVEDWFHILDNPDTNLEAQWRAFPSRVEEETERVLSLFEKHQCRATFFILGYIARKFPQLVYEIARRGHEIATHGDMHQLVYSQTPYTFEADLVNSMESIVKAGGGNPRAYRAPGFSITTDTMWAFEILSRNGIEVDASIFPASRAHGGLPGFSHARPCLLSNPNGTRLRSFPMNLGHIGPVALVFSGGGYFRLTPEPILNRLFDQNDYVMTYFHPRDFDSEQPVLPGLGRLRKFKSYVGLASALPKLDRLLARLTFKSLGEAELQVDWNAAPLVVL